MSSSFPQILVNSHGTVLIGRHKMRLPLSFQKVSFPFIPIDSYSRYLVNCCCGNCHWPYPKLTIPIECVWENDGHFSIWSKHHFKIVIRQAGRSHTSCRSAAVGVKGKGSMREWGVGGGVELAPKIPCGPPRYCTLQNSHIPTDWDDMSRRQMKRSKEVCHAGQVGPPRGWKCWRRTHSFWRSSFRAAERHK